MWRKARIALLLLVLAFVGSGAWFDRHRTADWQHTLWIGIFPINGDGRAATDEYIASLSKQQFVAIERFFEREAADYGVAIREPVHVELYPRVAHAPPRLAQGAGPLASIWWSLKIRWYAWRAASATLANVRMFVLYHDPEHTDSVAHSLGMQKGLLGVVNAYADRGMDGQNSIVITHEVMHALGATDKYDLATDLPVFPGGYADPDAEPLYPQSAAEIMAGRRAISATAAEMPPTLAGVLVGEETAAEINWVTK